MEIISKEKTEVVYRKQRPTKLTEKDVETLKQDYGVLSTKELVEKYQCSYSTIERFCKSHGFRSKRTPTTNKQYIKYTYLFSHLDELYQDYQENILTTEELEKKYQAPYTALYSQISLAGVKRKIKAEQIDVNALLEDYKIHHMSISNIVEKYNISATTLHNILKANDIVANSLGTNTRKYYFNEHFLDNIDSEQKAYFLRFVYADGCHDEKRHSLIIALQTRDAYILQQFYQICEGNYKVNYTYNKQYNRYYANFCIRSVLLSKRLLELGVMGNKTFKIRFPKWLSKELIPHFVRGFFDGDGTISTDGYSKFCGSKQFLSDLQTIISEELNITTKLTQDKNPKVGILKVTHIKENAIFLHWLYDNSSICLERKQIRAQKVFEKYN